MQKIKGQTPLQECHDIATAKLLIEAGADVNVKDKKGNTLLHLDRYDPNVTKLLIDAGLDVNAKNYEGMTPLFCIADHDTSGDKDYVESAKLLIEAGADVNAQNKKGQTPLHLCLDENLAKLFIEAGADVNAKDHNGNTRLHAFIPCDDDCIDDYDAVDDAYYHLEGYIRVMKVLIEAGADVNAKNNEGKTPLDLSGYYKVDDVLIKAGAIDQR